MRISAARTSGDDLTEENWTFCLIEQSNNLFLVLDEYTKETRKTKKHKAQVISKYTRLYDRHNTLTEKEVPWPEHIKLIAITQLQESIRAVKWAEIKDLF